jgi:hypothetical protein
MSLFFRMFALLLYKYTFVDFLGPCNTYDNSVGMYECRSPTKMRHENLFNNTEIYETYNVDDHIYINYN